MDALKLLKTDHEHLRDLLQRMLATTAEQVDLRQQLLALLRQELEIHVRVEDDLFYPVMDRQGLHGHRKVEQSRSEHQSMAGKLDDLDRADPSDTAWTTRVQTLLESVERHVIDDETDLFPLARDGLGAELETLGERMSQEKGDLLRGY